MNQTRIAQWVLRIAIAGEFVGHGVFALEQKNGWLKYFEAVGITPDTALTLMPLIGAMDLTLALLVLVRPMRAPLAWMSVWGLWTAMIRWPVGPDPMWDFVERWANWGAPLALFFLLGGMPRNFKEWWTTSTARAAHKIVCKDLTGEQCDFVAQGATAEEAKTAFYQHGEQSELHKEKYMAATREEAAEFGKKLDSYLSSQ